MFGSACGGGDNVGPNTPPVAAFVAPACTVNVPCSFTSTSTDADGTISTTAWDFGNGQTPTGVTASATFATAGTAQVKLTVTDNSGATGTVTNPVTVGATANQLPVASFAPPTDCVAGTPCGFASTSTDPDGDIALATFAWNFGDLGTGDGPNATHTYAAAGTNTVTLTVTDAAGGVGTATQQVIVAPAASQDCTTSGTVVDCSLGMSARVTVKLTIVSRSCELSGNSLRATSPRDQSIFFNLCNRPVGEEYVVKDAAGAPLVFAAGTSLDLRFNQGTADPQDPPTGDPGIQITGSYPNWTLNIDDGGAAGTQGEPDFNDAVVSVQATLAP